MYAFIYNTPLGVYFTLSILFTLLFACKYYACAKFHGKVWWLVQNLADMSLLEIGPVMFGGAEKIIDYFHQHEVLARSSNCARLFSYCNKCILFITLGLWRNKDSSICTTLPGPPRITGDWINLVEQTSRSHW